MPGGCSDGQPASTRARHAELQNSSAHWPQHVMARRRKKKKVQSPYAPDLPGGIVFSLAVKHAEACLHTCGGKHCWAGDLGGIAHTIMQSSAFRCEVCLCASCTHACSSRASLGPSEGFFIASSFSLKPASGSRSRIQYYTRHTEPSLIQFESLKRSAIMLTRTVSTWGRCGPGVSGSAIIIPGLALSIHDLNKQTPHLTLEVDMISRASDWGAGETRISGCT